MSRIVSRLEFAERLEGWPEGMPHPRPRGIKAFGKRYELAVQKQLPEAERGVWWRFRDRNGVGLCQTDFLVEGSALTLVLECKHTWTLEGITQLESLYLPVVELSLGRRVLGIQVCKHLTPWAEGAVCYSFDDAVNTARATNQPVTLHWRALGPLTGAIICPVRTPKGPLQLLTGSRTTSARPPLARL